MVAVRRQQWRLLPLLLLPLLLLALLRLQSLLLLALLRLRSLLLLVLPLVVRRYDGLGGRLLLLLWTRLLLLLLLLLLWWRCWPARRLLAAALQQLLHGVRPIHPAAPHPDCCMQQAPAKHLQLSRQALVAGMSKEVYYEPGLMIAERDLVAIHGRISGWAREPQIVVDIFRIEGGKLAEHWDVLQNEVHGGPAMGAVSMFDLSERAG